MSKVLLLRIQEIINSQYIYFANVFYNKNNYKVHLYRHSDYYPDKNFKEWVVYLNDEVVGRTKFDKENQVLNLINIIKNEEQLSLF